jgi:hypothetical protein
VSDQVEQDFGKIYDTFWEMREHISNTQKYSGKGIAIDKFYEAMRQFAYEIGLTPPYLPVGEDDSL